MSNADVIGRLHAAMAVLIKDYGYNDNPENVLKAITDAITALSAQDDVRDSVLKEVCAVQPYTATVPKTDYEVGFLHGVLAYGRAIRALKSKPATSTAERRTGEMTPEEYRDFWNGKNPARWTQPPAPEVKQGLADAHQYLKNWVRDVMPHAASSVSRGTLEHFAEEIQWWIDYRLAELDTRLGEKS